MWLSEELRVSGIDSDAALTFELRCVCLGGAIEWAGLVDDLESVSADA